jgi:hypothetical protein
MAVQAQISQGNAVPAGSPALFAKGLIDSPAASLQWFGRRTWRTFYATSAGHFQRPLFATQVAVLLPAIWGAVVCLRQPAWRWPAAASLLLVGTHWIVASIAEPLARSLAPLGGMLVIFAVVGVADAYERAFGRRLETSEK